MLRKSFRLSSKRDSTATFPRFSSTIKEEEETVGSQTSFKHQSSLIVDGNSGNAIIESGDEGQQIGIEIVGGHPVFKHQPPLIVGGNSGNVVIECGAEEKQVGICDTVFSFRNSRDLVHDIDGEIFSSQCGSRHHVGSNEIKEEETVGVDGNSGNVAESHIKEKQMDICNTADSFQNSQDTAHDIDDIMDSKVYTNKIFKKPTL